ncbi:MAG: hypothetical protein IPJ58_19120 [Ardenticatenia bacterium]|nr:hypothetical protein [Ardenticatenia bacterium]
MNPRPFGLRFAEAPTKTDQAAQVASYYDEASDLNLITLADGSTRVLVEVSPMTSTQTETKILIETTDNDPDSSIQSPSALLGTETITRVAVEETDSDPGGEDSTYFPKMLTQTETQTFVDVEETDSDQDPEVTRGGTMTITEVRAESTDDDPTCWSI